MKENIPNYFWRIKDVIETFSKADIKVIEDYIRFRRTRASDEKCIHYRNKIVILRDVAEVPFSKFNDKKLIENILILIKNSNRELTERNELRKVLKNFLKWKFNDIDVIESIKLEKQPIRNEKRINSSTLATSEEIKKLISSCKTIKEKAMITMIIELGLRPIELLNLKWKNIKFNDNHAEIEIFATKTNHTRTLPFKTYLIHLLRWKKEFEYPDRRDDDFVFPGKKREIPYYKQYLAMLFRRLCKRANIRNINPYLLRHTVLTNVYKKSKDTRMTAKYGGHSIAVSETYNNLDKDDIKKLILETLHNVKEPDIQTKHKLEKEIEVLKKEVENSKEIMKITAQVYDIFVKKKVLKFNPLKNSE